MSFKAGFIGVIGLPNSGKSTLVNRLVGEKVSIVSRKPQTTRRRSLGIRNVDQAQIIFVDAPGILSAKAGLNHFLMEEAADVVSKADVLLVVLNIDESNLEKLQEMIKLAENSGRPWVAVIHKTDLPELHRPEILRRELSEKNIPVVQGSSVQADPAFDEKIIAELVKVLPVADRPIYDAEIFTPATERELCAEIIREKCFEHLHHEIPFGTAVRIQQFKENDKDVVKIRAEVVVAKKNHQGMVVGREARTIKQIGIHARQDIEKLLDRKVFLELEVATVLNWQKNPHVMKELGYVVG